MTSQRHGSRGRLLHHGARFDLVLAAVAARDGSEVERELVVHPGSVVILPLTAAGEVVLIRNHRFAVEQTLWELPAGTLDSAEDPRDCAERELAEETGYRAQRIEPLLDFFAAPGWCDERMYAFVARDLTPGQPALEPTEQIEVLPTSWAEIDNLLRRNEICDCKTIATLLYYRAYRADM